jgi:hypothetical protein
MWSRLIIRATEIVTGRTKRAAQRRLAEALLSEETWDSLPTQFTRIFFSKLLKDLMGTAGFEPTTSTV